MDDTGLFDMYFQHRQLTIMSSVDTFFKKIEEGCGW